MSSNTMRGKFSIFMLVGAGVIPVSSTGVMGQKE